MFLKSLGLLSLAALAGCGPQPARPPDAPTPNPASDYAAAPSVTEVRMVGAAPVLSGTAPPGAPVRLGSPDGAALLAAADPSGHWSLRLPPAAEPRIFGLSARLGKRQVQGQGYLLVTAQGRAALLRAGAGAIRLDPLRSPALTALDTDNGGAAVISGLAPADTLLFLRIDGEQVAQARADGVGRYGMALNQPLSRGAHTLEVSGDSFVNTAQVEVAPAQPLAAGPLRSQFTRGGLRVDWLTPGGGVQSTVLLD